jgi:molecular chaperone DnaK (HSP70)
MTYGLGVDLGTSFVAAAVARPSGIEMCPLDDHSMVTPAVVAVRDDGTVLTGDAAERYAAGHPDRAHREVKRRMGDRQIMLGGVPYRATTLLGAHLRDVVEQVAAAEGAQPARIVLTCPPGWEPLRRQMFDEVGSTAGLPAPLVVSEAEAVAGHALTGRLRDGEVVAVHDLGGGTFDATLLRKHAEGLAILGAEGIDGGVDLDEAVMSFVDSALGGALAGLDRTDPPTAVALARLRRECILAKEALSWDTDTVIPVFLPGQHGEVRLTRAAFEKMVRAPVEATVGAMSRILRSAGLTPSDLGAVLLVGGSSRIPLVAETVSRAFGRTRVDDVHPKYAVALGAAALAAASMAAVPAPGSIGVRVRPVTVGAASAVMEEAAERTAPLPPIGLRTPPWRVPEQRAVPACEPRKRPEMGPMSVLVAIAMLALVLVSVLAPGRAPAPVADRALPPRVVPSTSARPGGVPPSAVPSTIARSGGVRSSAVPSTSARSGGVRSSAVPSTSARPRAVPPDDTPPQVTSARARR